MGSVAQSVSNAVTSTVNTVKDTVSSVVEHPLQGVAKVVELPLKVSVDQVASLGPATQGIPVVGTLTKGAGAASKALDSIEAGKVPDIKDLRDVAAAGGAIAGAGMDGGIFSGFADTGFDFGSFLGGAPSPSKPSPTITIHAPAQASSSGQFFSPDSGIDFTKVAILAGVAVGGYLILMRK